MALGPLILLPNYGKCVHEPVYLPLIGQGTSDLTWCAMKRRTLLATTVAGTTASLPGCSGITGSSDDDSEHSNSNGSNDNDSSPPFNTVEPPAQDLLLELDEAGDQWVADEKRTTDGSNSGFDSSSLVEVAHRQYVNEDFLYLKQIATLFRDPSSAATGYERVLSNLEPGGTEYQQYKELSLGDEAVAVLGAEPVPNRANTLLLQGNVLFNLVVEPSDDSAPPKEDHFQMAVDYTEQLYQSWG